MKTIAIPFACALGILTCLSAEGGTVSGVSGAVGNLPAGKAIIFSHAVTIAGGTSVTDISSQGTVSGSNFSAVLTDDLAVGGATDPTVTGVQQVPALTGILKWVTKDLPESFAVTEFDAGFSDLNVGDALQVLRITSLPSKGVIKQGAVPIVAIPVDIPRANIADLSYHPDENEEGADSFGWNASDGAVFAAAGASVNLTITGINVLTITPVGLGFDILFSGIPGRSYRIQSNDTFPTPPWVDRTTLSADPQGRFTFSDAAPLPPIRMYRSVSP